MPKIKLGKRPETFKPFPVTFTMPDGESGSILATFRYRTRTEFGDLLNQMFANAGQEPPADGAPDFKTLFGKAGEKNAQHLHAALAAWDLDEELTVENLKQFVDEQPAAAAALMAAYSAAANEGRLGN